MPHEDLKKKQEDKIELKTKCEVWRNRKVNAT
jgi:hypothetical protein